ncbi:hypothetical protein ACHAWO_005451 [Cyclotella atomus]|uniref:Uncharacterized protein n=1 Tax=Cyclotella atomus TaxID=382360 RepID=A0ABD3QXS9_9STRA
MAEPPAEDFTLSTSHADPPTSSTSSNPLEAHFAKHRHHSSSDSASYSSPVDSISREPSKSGSYNASRPNGGDAPSIGYSVRSADDATVRSGGASTVYSYSTARKDKHTTRHVECDDHDEEETAHLLNGRSNERYPNPYRKHQRQATAATATTTNNAFNNNNGYSNNRSGRRRHLQSKLRCNSLVKHRFILIVSVVSCREYFGECQCCSNSGNYSGGGSSILQSIGNTLLQQTLRISHIKKNATILSIMALGMMIFIGGAINLTGSITAEETVVNVKGGDSSGTRGLDLDYNRDADVIVDNNTGAAAGGGGIMDNVHHSKSKVVSGPISDQIDWNKVPPHLRGYYSKAFGNANQGQAANHNPASSEITQIKYRNEGGIDNDYEHSQFSNKAQALAIQSIGQEAVLGYRPFKKEERDYHQQGLLNQEFTAENGGGGGFSGPLVGKDAFAEAEEGPLPNQHQGASPQQGHGLSSAAIVDNSEEEKRLAAQEAALQKAATAEVDARKRRQDELAQLRASAGLTGGYYTEGQVPRQPSVEEGRRQQQQKEEEAKHQIELVREQMKQEAEVAQQPQVELQSAENAPLLPAPKDGEAAAEEEARHREEEKRRQAEAAAQQEDARHREEEKRREAEAAAQQEEARHREEEKRLREELAAREQQLARQQAEEKANRLKLEYAQQLAEEERQKNGSPAEQLMSKYVSVPFEEQTKSVPVEEKMENPPPQVEQQEPPQQQQKPPQQQPPPPTQEQPPQNLPDISEWRTAITAKFHERFKADEKVDHTAIPPPGQAKSPHQTSLLTEKPRQQEKPEQETNYRLQIANGELPFDEWRSMMAKKLHALIMAEHAKNAPPEPSPSEVKEKVSQKMEEVEQAQNAVMAGESTDLESITALQKELSELLSLLGGGG